MLIQFDRRKIITLSNFKEKSTELSRISSRLSKETLDKLKFNKKSYAQTSKSNMENIIYIKDAFPKLPTKKINNIVNNKMSQAKYKINMITKSPSRKQIIIPINKNNSKVIGNFANFHIFNINRCLKKTKSNTITNFI